MKSKSLPQAAFTMVEVIVVLVIVGVLAGILFMTLSGLKSGDHIDRGAQQIYDDLIYIRSRAVSANQNHRINFTSPSQWSLQTLSGTAWTLVGSPRTMPSDTYLSNTSYSNAGSNLFATPRGLFQFNNNASGTPYIVVTGFGTSKTKSVYVYVGGALELRTP